MKELGLQNWTKCLIALLASSTLLVAQTGSSARVMGSVTAKDAQTLTVKPETGEPVTVDLTGAPRIQRVAPGERDLSKAETIAIDAVSNGDRVLVRGSAGDGGRLRASSVIVISAQSLAARDQAEQKKWQERGIFGVVEGVDAARGEVRVSLRSGIAAAQPVTVTVQVPTTATIKRYKPDSIRFADAVQSTLTDVRRGDQLRALGEKSADGTRLTAEQVVFGTFRTVAGTVIEVAADSGRLTLKDLQNGQTVTVVVKSDSRVKRMPSFGAGGGPGAGGGMSPGGPTAGMGSQGRGMRPGGGAGIAGGSGPGTGRGPDIAAIVERLPAASLADIRTGETVIVSSTAGAANNQLTAIVLLGGADPIIKMLQARAQAQQGPDPLAGGGNFGGGLEGALGVMQ